MREMKDSGVAWIGEIPHDWSLVRFKDKYKNVKEIAKEQSANYERLALTMGGVIKRPKDDSDGLQPKEFDSYQILRENDFVFKMIDLQNVSTSRVGLSPYTGLVSPAYIRFTPKNEGQYSQFVYYYLMCLYYNQVFNNLGGNGVRSALSAKDMGEFVIPFPDGAEQKKICAMLDEKFAHVDSLIANVQAQIEKLKAYKQSLITEVVTKGLDPNAPMKDSGVEWIGKIPAHWSILRFKNIADIKSNLVNPKDYMDYFQVSPENIEKGSGKLLTCITVREIGVESNNHLFHKGQIIYSKVRPLLNKVAIAPFDGLCSADMYPVEAKINKKFLVYSMLSDSFLNQVKLVTENRVKMPKINQEELSKIKVCCPEDSEQKRIADYLDAKCSQIDRLISLKESKIEKLQQYKRSLIYEYVTGKKEVV